MSIRPFFHPRLLQTGGIHHFLRFLKFFTKSCQGRSYYQVRDDQRQMCKPRTNCPSARFAIFDLRPSYLVPRPSCSVSRLTMEERRWKMDDRQLCGACTTNLSNEADETRTHNLRIDSPMLYPIELRPRVFLSSLILTTSWSCCKALFWQKCQSTAICVKFVSIGMSSILATGYWILDTRRESRSESTVV